MKPASETFGFLANQRACLESVAAPVKQPDRQPPKTSA